MVTSYEIFTRLLCVGICIAGMSVARLANAADVIVGFELFSPPFIVPVGDDQSSYTGIEIETVRHALQASGHELVVQIAPLKRRIRQLSVGTLDGLSSVQLDQVPDLHYTEEYVGYQNFAIGRNSGLIAPTFTDQDETAHSERGEVMAQIGAAEFPKALAAGSVDRRHAVLAQERGLSLARRWMGR